VAHGNPYQEVKVHLITWEKAPLVMDVAPPGHSCGTPHTVSTMAPVKLAPLDNMDRLLMMTLPVATIAAPVATVPTRPRSRVRRAPTKLRPVATPVTGWSKVRVLRVILPIAGLDRRIQLLCRLLLLGLVHSVGTMLKSVLVDVYVKHRMAPAQFLPLRTLLLLEIRTV
jgi:hypothetical protein